MTTKKDKASELRERAEELRKDMAKEDLPKLKEIKTMLDRPDMVELLSKAAALSHDIVHPMTRTGQVLAPNVANLVNAAANLQNFIDALVAENEALLAPPSN